MYAISSRFDALHKFWLRVNTVYKNYMYSKCARFVMNLIDCLGPRVGYVSNTRQTLEPFNVHIILDPEWEGKLAMTWLMKG